MAPHAPAQATLVARTPSALDGGRARTLAATRAARASWEPVEADPPLAPGAVIDGRYRVVGLVGEGGMGRVYETEHLFLRRRLALKLVRRDAGTGEAAARLLQEAVLAGKVPHATVVPVFDCAALPDGQVYVAMELLRGESLEDALLRPQPAQEVLRWLAEVARGLAAAHRQAIVHRDVKPANVFLARTTEGTIQPRILDFGIAKLLPGLSGGAAEGVQTQAGALLGTPFYMAPERIRGETGDGRADLYSLGVILYEALTGQVPFLGATFMEIVGRHLQDPPLDPRQAAPARQIPDALAELALALLRKDPAARPDDGEAVAAQLLAAGADARRAGLTLGAEPQGAAAEAGAVTQAIVEAATQRLGGAEVAAAASGEAVLESMAERTGFDGHVLKDVVEETGRIGHVVENMDGEAGLAAAAGPGSASGGRRLRALGLAGAVVIAAGLIGWVALRRGEAAGAGDLPPAPAVAPPSRAAAPGPEGQGGVAPGPRAVAPEPATEPEEPAIARPAAETAGSEPETPVAGDRGEGEAAGDPAAPEPEGEAAKKRGKRPVRKKAGTTDAGPAGPSPKIKTDVYDE